MLRLPLFYDTLHYLQIYHRNPKGNAETYREISTMADLAMNWDLKISNLMSKEFRIKEINGRVEDLKRYQTVRPWACICVSIGGSPETKTPGLFPVRADPHSNWEEDLRHAKGEGRRFENQSTRRDNKAR